MRVNETPSKMVGLSPINPKQSGIRLLKPWPMLIVRLFVLFSVVFLLMNSTGFLMCK